MIVPVDQLTDRDLSLIEYVVIHHSDAPKTVDIADLAVMEEHSQDFITIGYNAYVKKTPYGWIIQEGRPMDKLPAAQIGLNEQGYAICIGGNYEPDQPNPTDSVEPESLKLVVERVEAVKAKCPNLKYLIGHRDVATIHMKKDGISQEDASSKYGTACPGNLLYAHLHDLRIATELHSPPELL